jgi:hypothetical protein
MANQNLTKELKRSVKETIDPIFEELQEQIEASRFYRQLASFRDKSFESIKTAKNEPKLLQM